MLLHDDKNAPSKWISTHFDLLKKVQNLAKGATLTMSVWILGGII